jgi:hypothetical protein
MQQAFKKSKTIKIINMKAQHEPKKLSFEKIVISVLQHADARHANGMNQWNPTLQSTIPECDVITTFNILVA